MGYHLPICVSLLPPTLRLWLFCSAMFLSCSPAPEWPIGRACRKELMAEFRQIVNNHHKMVRVSGCRLRQSWVLILLVV